jgi:hypothetical protein
MMSKRDRLTIKLGFHDAAGVRVTLETALSEVARQLRLAGEAAPAEDIRGCEEYMRQLRAGIAAIDAARVKRGRANG